ncbi:MAG: triose-phosphate isomerase [Elusimicrobiota bacterium]
MNQLRRPLIAGNWKMHQDAAGTRQLIGAIARDLGAPPPAVEIAVCPPHPLLCAAAEALRGSAIRLGAQNLHWEKDGAYTGEVSAEQLVDAGCAVVLIGHSERRRYFGETDETVARKIKAARRAGLCPIVCVGESLDERESQKTYGVLRAQIQGALTSLAPVELSSVSIAYEPIWAIGTGKTAAPAQAQDAHLFIRKTAAELFGSAAAAGLRIIYGGSVKPETIDALMAQPDVDGALVGGESLKPISFLRIIHFQALAGSH